MFRNLAAEQARRGLTNQQVADALGIKLNTYMWKKRTGKFFYHEIVMLLELFGCTFEYLLECAETGGDQK